MPRKRQPKISSTKEVDTPGRGSSIDVPHWWIDYAETRFKERHPDWSLNRLGAELAAKLNRPAPWSHAKLSRFFAKVTVTGEVADALKLLYPDLPDYVYFPRDPEEAIAFRWVQQQAEVRRAAADAAMRERIRILTDRAGVTNPDQVVSQRTRDRQADPLASPHAEVSPGAGHEGVGGRRGRLGTRRP